MFKKLFVFTFVVFILLSLLSCNSRDVQIEVDSAGSTQILSEENSERTEEIYHLLEFKTELDENEDVFYMLSGFKCFHDLVLCHVNNRNDTIYATSFVGRIQEEDVVYIPISIKIPEEMQYDSYEVLPAQLSGNSGEYGAYLAFAYNGVKSYYLASTYIDSASPYTLCLGEPLESHQIDPILKAIARDGYFNGINGVYDE